MVNVRMDDETIAFLDKVGPTRSDAVRKCVSLAQANFTVPVIQRELVSVSRLADQRSAPDPDEVSRETSILDGEMTEP
jgi:hypothetical protein